jgi:putative transposase
MDSPRYFQEDTYHHLYNRGANKAKIFFDKNDYYYFLKKLKKYNQKYSIEILCYCLMINHFHIFVRQTTQEKSIGNFVGDLTNSYTKTINKKYKRTGVIFEGKTKNKIIYDEDAFTVLAKYILLNPVRAKLVAKFEDWEFSSANELLNGNEDQLTDDTILRYFKSVQDFKNYITIEEDFEVLKNF